jgi:hypothetical protein
MKFTRVIPLSVVALSAFSSVTALPVARSEFVAPVMISRRDASDLAEREPFSWLKTVAPMLIGPAIEGGKWLWNKIKSRDLSDYDDELSATLASAILKSRSGDGDDDLNAAISALLARDAPSDLTERDPSWGSLLKWLPAVAPVAIDAAKWAWGKIKGRDVSDDEAAAVIADALLGKRDADLDAAIDELFSRGLPSDITERVVSPFVKDLAVGVAPAVVPYIAKGFKWLWGKIKGRDISGDDISAIASILARGDNGLEARIRYATGSPIWKLPYAKPYPGRPGPGIFKPAVMPYNYKPSLQARQEAAMTDFIRAFEDAMKA